MNVYEKEKSENDYEQYLNDAFGTVEICGMTFDQGTALKELDPTAFRCGMSDEPIIYVCGECNREFQEDEQDKAEECCKEDEPEEEETEP